MPYTINHHTNLDIGELAFTGFVSGSELREATTNCIDLQKKVGVTRFLVYVNGSEILASFVDLYEIAEKQYDREGVDRQSRIAVVFPTTLSAQAASHFYETVCQNRGWNAQVHPDRESALDWLMDTT
jgi:hypothetical protein